MNETEGDPEEGSVAETIEKYRPFTPMQAMDTYAELALQGGQQTIENYPRRSELIKTMAHLKVSNIIDWANTRVPIKDQGTEKFKEYYQGIVHYHEVCCKIEEVPPATSRIN